ncbi:PREDICTED: F-box protein At4g35733-like [Camelina sativa]|uniref:F-box protein At4g35733-like n=1 Tax=Camelina sativa TaxID=90675 RepID=A0ABM0U5R1_CAMSA|nr:PREDICTED: F-box protein At4g35733-like [Camelina sativa]
MSKVIEWSDLPGDLLDYIANGLFSKVELLRFRSICKTWRSSVVTNKKRFRNHINRNRRRRLSSYDTRRCILCPAALCRVIISSCPDKGWLIKIRGIYGVSSKSKLLSPLSRNSIDSPSGKTLDLLKFTVSEIHQFYDVLYEYGSRSVSSYNFARVVLVGDLVFVVNCNKEIWWCNSNECKKPWTRIVDEEVENFSDILFHKGHLYALDWKGAIWWISLSELNIFQYGPSTPLEYYEVDDCKDKRLVEYCGDLCIVHRFCKKFTVKGVKLERTSGFKVYKMDVENVKWVEVKSLGDEAFVMATDSCFSVLAREYYGCLENSIYFIDKEDKKGDVKVFKLGDGSITKMADDSSSSSSHSCFQMLNPSFV